MQFVKNGPNVPEKLIQAHEEGRVVFFCGAGISFPAKLPGFGKLVRDLYDQVGVLPDEVQELALKNSQFDTAVSLLESVTPTKEWRRDVRKNLSLLLTPDYSSSKATQTHRSLLRLSVTSENKMRLITTNFDTVFKQAADEEKIKLKEYSAPLLPVPKNRWDGLVYLHGLLPEDEHGLDHLVISSGDFGLAYLTERWAARFVSELFRTYTVCFIGYSLNDPVLRYMMDALAADKQLGESPPEMYAFGNYKVKEYEKEKKNWLAKNVTPILYKNHHHHYYLHETLSKWADTYRDGLSGKEQIVVTTAYTNPMQSDVHNDYAKRLAWALSDPSGVPAKTFAELNPTPPISWLKVLEEIELSAEDLSRYGVIDKSLDVDKKYSLFKRPPKSSLAPPMALASHVYQETLWDDVMSNLAKWLIKHINNPELILFIVRQGGKLDPKLKHIILNEIKEQDRNRKKGNSQYFEQLNSHSPDRIVSNKMKPLWLVVLAGYTEQPNNIMGFYDWVESYKLNGVNVILKKSIRSVLSPRVIFKSPFRYNKNNTNIGIKSHIEWEFGVSSSHTHPALDNLIKSESWNDESYKLIQDFTSILIELMELKGTLGDINDKTDYSYISRPSIKEHSQNNDYSDWTVLIDLVKDSWISLNKNNPDTAKIFANQFWEQPFPIFKRIALFCANESDTVSIQTVISWLSVDNAYWLWNVSTHREVLQLLRNLYNRANNEQYQVVLKLIMSGPKREWYKEEVSQEEFENLCDRAIWLRLQKLQQDGGSLTKEATDKQELILKSNPEWKLADDDRDEFPFWTGKGNQSKSVISSPKDKESLIEWLKEEGEDRFWVDDDWATRCQDDFDVTSGALKAIAKDEKWLIERWREAIQVWSENENLNQKTAIELFLFILDAPDKVLLELSWHLATWLKKLLSRGCLNDDKYLELFDSLAHLPFEIDVDNVSEPINLAINNPAGILVESLFSWWYSKTPIDNDGLIEEFQIRLEKVCDLDNPHLYLGRVIVCANLLPLFRVDPDWTISNVIPWLSWDDEPLSSMAWQSLLWSPRLHKGFIYEIKDELVKTSHHYNSLGKLGTQYVIFMTYLSLQGYSEFKVGELASIFNIIPSESLYNVASALKDSLSSSGDKNNEFWKNRIKPFLIKLWPKKAKLDNNTVEQLSLLCIAARNNFPEAYDIIKHRLSYLHNSEYVTRQVYSSGLIESNPKLCLEFLGKIIGEPKYQPPTKLADCLHKLEKEDIEIVSSQEYKRLKTMIDRFSR